MIRAAAIVFPVLLLAACTSAPGTQTGPDAAGIPTESANAQGEFWAQMKDGLLVHQPSGAVCPLQVGAFERFATQTFAADGGDVSCQYETADATSFLTLYFSYFGDLSATDHVRQMVPAIRLTKGLEPVEDAGLDCEMVIELAGAMETAGQGGEAPIPVGSTPCVVFAGQRQKSLLAVRKYAGWHIKSRLTVPDTGDEGDMAMYELVGRLFALQDGSIPVEPDREATPEEPPQKSQT